MSAISWNDQRLKPDKDELVFELYHENSKLSRNQSYLSNEEVMHRMAQLEESLPYVLYPQVALPATTLPFRRTLAETLRARVTARRMSACSLTIEQVATVLHYAYGVTRDNRESGFPRPFRTVPSGGALYPLELYFQSAQVEQLEQGLYHFSAARHQLEFIRRGDLREELGRALAEPGTAYDSSMIIFITAVFERSTFKYGDRGYRFALLEAGHVAQNINLAAIGLGLGCINLGGFFDRDVDEFIGLDGVTHSTIYLIGIGENLDDPLLLPERPANHEP